MDSIQIEGIIVNEPLNCTSITIFMVQTIQNEVCQVISENDQAAKDNIFIMKGQYVIIDAIEIIVKPYKILFSKKSKIVLNR